jgi:membrane protein implicated in regulation of membrane protease activity
MGKTRQPGTQTGSPFAAALRTVALTRADAFARWAARARGTAVCAAVLTLVVAWLAGAAYGIETAGAVAAVATCVVAMLAAFAAWVVWERRRERATRSGRRRRARCGSRRA